LSNENNVEKFDWYKKYSKLPVKEIEAAVMTKQMSHHEELTFRQKLCLPLWCWRSFIHDKHEAFRFKYDTNALLMLEDEMGDKITLFLYVNSAVYYVIMFVCPIIFVEECGQGLSYISHHLWHILAACSHI
jgi:cyanate permease